MHLDHQYISYGSTHFIVNAALIASVYINIVISMLLFIKYTIVPKFDVPKSFPIRITICKRKAFFAMVANILFLEMLVILFTHEGYLSFSAGEIILGIGISLIILFSMRHIADPWHMIINHQGINMPKGYGLIEWEDVKEVKQVSIETVSKGFSSDYVLVSVNDPNTYLRTRRDSQASRLDQIIQKRRYIDYWKNGIKHKNTVNFLIDDLDQAAFLEKLIKEAWKHCKKVSTNY